MLATWSASTSPLISWYGMAVSRRSLSSVRLYHRDALAALLPRGGFLDAGVAIHVSGNRRVARHDGVLADADEQGAGHVSRTVHHSRLAGDELLLPSPTEAMYSRSCLSVGHRYRSFGHCCVCLSVCLSSSFMFVCLYCCVAAFLYSCLPVCLV